MSLKTMKYAVMMLAGLLAASLAAPAESPAKSRPALETGRTWNGFRIWSKHKAGDRSFKFESRTSLIRINRVDFRSPLRGGFRIPVDRHANRGATLGTNLAADKRTPKRSYGSSGRISHRQRIIIHRGGHTGRRIQRGATIGKPK